MFRGRLGCNFLEVSAVDYRLSLLKKVVNIVLVHPFSNQSIPVCRVSDFKECSSSPF